MKTRMFYRQCTLRKQRSASAVSEIVSYVPAKFARVSKTLRLKQTDGSWDDGWQVESVGHELCDADLPDAHRGVKHHRQSTGDAWPRKRI